MDRRTSLKALGALSGGLYIPASFAQSPLVAFAQDTLQNDFRKAQVMQAQEEAKKYSTFRFEYSDAQGKTALLINQIDTWIEKGAKVLIVGTNDAKAVVPVISKAHKAGVKVIILDRGVDTTDYSCFINSDNVKIGQIGGSYIGAALKNKKRAKVLLFEGLQSADVTHLRTQGFMQEMAKYKNIEVIKRTGNYLRKDAVIEMEKLVQSGEKVDAIFSESDSMLSGVRLVLERFKIDPKSIIMIGCDYTSEARDAIAKGTQTGSVLFPLGGDVSVQVADKLLQGQSVPKNIVIPVKLVLAGDINTVRPVF